jgi:hypothetical protein
LEARTSSPAAKPKHRQRLVDYTDLFWICGCQSSNSPEHLLPGCEARLVPSLLQLGTSQNGYINRLAPQVRTRMRAVFSHKSDPSSREFVQQATGRAKGEMKFSSTVKLVTRSRREEVDINRPDGCVSAVPLSEPKGLCTNFR